MSEHGSAEQDESSDDPAGSTYAPRTERPQPRSRHARPLPGTTAGGAPVRRAAPPAAIAQDDLANLASFLLSMYDRMQSTLEQLDARVEAIEVEQRRGRRTRGKMRRDIDDLRQSRDEIHTSTQRQISEVRELARSASVQVADFQPTVDFFRRYLGQQLWDGDADE